MANDCKRIIIDTDPGIDDGHAILVFLQAEKLKMVKIEAIIVTMGNTTLENACRNLIRLLEVAHRTDIPVYKGVRNALVADESASTYFGKDGFGDVAPLAIKDIIYENPGEITLVCLAPMTNVALAATLYCDLFSKVKEIFVMGGNSQGKENVTASAEFNFYCDPESAYIFLKKVTCPTTILPFEACLNAGIDVNWRFGVLNCASAEMEFMSKVERNFYTFMTYVDLSGPFQM